MIACLACIVSEALQEPCACVVGQAACHGLCHCLVHALWARLRVMEFAIVCCLSLCRRIGLLALLALFLRRCMKLVHLCCWGLHCLPYLHCLCCWFCLRHKAYAPSLSASAGGGHRLHKPSTTPRQESLKNTLNSTLYSIQLKYVRLHAKTKHWKTH